MNPAKSSKTWDASLVIAFCILLSGCTSMVTTEKGPDSLRQQTKEKGMGYYLPSVAIKVVGNWDATYGIWDLTATPIYGPDIAAGRYTAVRHKNYLFDDDLLLAVDANGLIQTVNGTTTDESGNSAGSLLSAAATVYSAGFSGAAAAAAAVGRADELSFEAATKGDFSSFETFLSPIVTNEDLNCIPSLSLPQASHIVHVASPMVNGQVVYGTYVISLATQMPVSNSNFPCAFGKYTNKFDGILVRDPIPYNLSVEGYLWDAYYQTNIVSNGKVGYLTGSTGTSGQQGQQSSPLRFSWSANAKFSFMTNSLLSQRIQYDALEQTFLLPDASHTHVIEISRTPMVTDSTKLSLANGMVQSREDVRPSTVFGWFGLPKTIVTAVVPFIGTGGSGGGGSGGGGSGGGGSGGGGSGGGGSGGGGSGGGGGGGGGAQTPISPPIQ